MLDSDNETDLPSGTPSDYSDTMAYALDTQIVFNGIVSEVAVDLLGKFEEVACSCPAGFPLSI